MCLMMENLWWMWQVTYDYLHTCNSTLILSLHCNRHSQNKCTPLMQQTDLWDCPQGCRCSPLCCDHQHLRVWVIKLINASVCSLPILLQQAITSTSISPARFLYPLQLINYMQLLVECWRGLFSIGFDFLYNSSYFIFSSRDHPLPPPLSWTPLFWENV